MTILTFIDILGIKITYNFKKKCQVLPTYTLKNILSCCCLISFDVTSVAISGYSEKILKHRSEFNSVINSKLE